MPKDGADVLVECPEGIGPGRQQKLALRRCGQLFKVRLVYLVSQPNHEERHITRGGSAEGTSGIYRAQAAEIEAVGKEHDGMARQRGGLSDLGALSHRAIELRVARGG